MHHPLRRPAVLLLALIFAGGCSYSLNPLTGKRRPYGFSWQQEKELGAQADAQITAQFGVYEDAGLQAYVDRVGRQVLSESHLRSEEAAEMFQETDFTFRILDSEVVNAFALPGGYVYVTRGLLAHLENEAQLAVVLGHEVGHVAARHAAERAFEQQLGQLGVLGGALLGAQLFDVDPQDLLNVGGVAAQLLFLRYSRDDEREADRLGVEYAAKSQYVAAEGAGFFGILDRIQEQEGQRIPGFLATHPDPGQREETIVALASEWRGSAQMTQVRQEPFLRALDGMVVGQNPRNGFVEGDTFHHPELRFRFDVPGGFEAMNQAAQVVMVDSEQQAVLGFQLAQAASAEAAARDFASQEGLEVIDRGNTSSQGLPASYVMVAAQNQKGVVLQALTWFVEYRGQVYGFIGYTQRDAFSRFEERFLAAMRSFAPERDPEVLAVQPARIDVVEAPGRAPLRTLVSANLPRDLTPADVAIMNHLELDSVVEAGTLLKIVRPAPVGGPVSQR